ncbi:MAG: RtcB family protein, partial [candidate division NC10 bacterium]
GVVATDAEHGVVSPGAIGFDINCGVRLLRTALDAAEIGDRMERLVDALFAAVPTGVGSRSSLSLDAKTLDEVMERGAAWAVERGYGLGEDLGRIESDGRLAAADPARVSDRARERGRRQLGTLGSGNHFLEVQVVDEVHDERAASALGVRAGQLTVMIHTGSRGLGHQVCTDYLDVTGKALRRYGITVPDRQLACAPVDSAEGRAYLGAMGAAANFAFANRQVLSHWAREVFQRALGIGARELGMAVVYDVAHNIAKEEEHEVDGARRRLLVHRKGATRAFPGQPVIVPGDMGRASYLLLGTEVAMRETFGSTCHGAGRLLSRTAAVKAARGRRIDQELRARGVVARATGRDALAEEMPEAYKDVTEVVDVVHRFGISSRVARLRPLGVIKG